MTWTDIARDFASGLVDTPDLKLTRRIGLVTAVAAGPPSVTLTIGATTGIAGVRYLESVSPMVGDYVVVLFAGPDGLIVGKIRGAALTATPGVVFNTGLELYQGSSTPYVDFHAAASPAGDSNADYNMRMWLQASGNLEVLGGHFQVNSSTGTNVVATGTGGGYEFHERDNLGTSWVWYATGGASRLWSGGDIVTVDHNGVMNVGINQAGGAICGPSVAYGVATYCEFRHKSAGTNYAVLQSTSDTFFNAVTTGHLRIGNGDVMNWASGLVQMTGTQLQVLSPFQPAIIVNRTANYNDAMWFNSTGGNNTAHTMVDQPGLGFRWWNGTAGVDEMHVTGGSQIGGSYLGTATPAITTRAGTNNFSINWTGTMQFWIDATNVKNFVIPHPVDRDRYLVHACVEGPEATVVYRGQHQLDRGWVQVDLPSYFEALCEEEGRSVMLTAIADDPEDEFCPVLHATYPKDGRFFVGLGSGMVVHDQRFWWEVKARRRGVSMMVEPRRDEIEVMGNGPYTYYRERKAS